MVLPSLAKIAVAALWANRLRSGLTLLGVIIGVTSVMTIISALEGMMGAIEDDLAVLGPTTFIITKAGGVITSHEQWMEMMKRKPLDMQSWKLLEEGCVLCEKICPRTDGSANVKRGNNTMKRVWVSGGTSNMIDIVDFEVAQGRFYSVEDDLYRRRVAFIGDDVREELFGQTDPLEKTIRIGGIRYTVCGVAKRRGSMFGESQDEFIYIPFSAHIKQFGYPRRGLRFAIKAQSLDELQNAQDQARMILRAQRHVPY
ncbi:MAG: ABC transporter permease, partial [candidate division Zixibacteria bacterium]|nr:ABC transporter permease [candidate division Zixibacteria bacterium]